MMKLGLSAAEAAGQQTARRVRQTRSGRKVAKLYGGEFIAPALNDLPYLFSGGSTSCGEPAPPTIGSTAWRIASVPFHKSLWRRASSAPPMRPAKQVR